MRFPSAECSSWRLRALQLLAALAVVAAIVITRPPAAWLADLLQAHSRLRLIDPQGTLWQGSAQLAVSDGRRALLVPGRLTWRASLAGFLGAKVEIRHPATLAPVRVSIEPGKVEIEAGHAQTPAALLSALGTPFNTVRPGGTLHVQWSALRLKQEAAHGDVRLEWRDAQSALSPVAPLGDFLVVVKLRGEAGEVALRTLRGPLHMEGRGSLTRGQLAFTGQAFAEEPMRAALLGLIGVLGKRSGDRAQLRLGT
jgi:general secretion pathway protein N